MTATSKQQVGDPARTGARWIVPARLYISLVSAAGVAAMAFAFARPQWPHDPARFCIYLLLSLIAATVKLRLPGLTSTMSIGFVFVLLGISEFTPPETMLIACAGVVVQCFWRAQSRPTPVQVIFSVSAVATSLMLAYGCAQAVRAELPSQSFSIAMAAATCLYFVSNSLLVSGVLSLVKREPLRAVWRRCYRFAFPYYLLGGVVAGLLAALSRETGWKLLLLVLPVMGVASLLCRFPSVAPKVEAR